jgi:hypothetical protein
MAFSGPALGGRYREVAVYRRRSLSMNGWGRGRRMAATYDVVIIGGEVTLDRL